MCKTITTPNYLIVLVTEDIAESVFIASLIIHHDVTGIIPHAKHTVTSQVPPICIKNINNYSDFNNVLTNITSPNLLVNQLLHI